QTGSEGPTLIFHAPSWRTSVYKSSKIPHVLGRKLRMHKLQSAAHKTKQRLKNISNRCRLSQ
ncbi:MAG: hypothetical protein WCO53_14515, partial [Deltaproteobacteria bacterium]